MQRKRTVLCLLFGLLVCPARADVPNYVIQGPTAVAVGAETVTLSVAVACAETPVSFDIAVDYSEWVLSLLDVTKTLTVGGNPPGVFDVTVGPTTCTTAANDSLEGYVAFHIELAENAGWQFDAPYEVAQLTFALRRSAGDFAGKTIVRLRDVGPENQFGNVVRVLSNGTVLTREPKRVNLTISLPGIDQPRVASGEEVQATFRLSEGAGTPGATGIPIYFYIESNTALDGFLVAFTYDRNVLAIESFESLMHLAGEAPDYAAITVETPSDPAAPHGAALGVVSDFENQRMYYPVAGEPAALARFTVLPGATEGASGSITFQDEVIGLPPVDNVVVFRGLGLPPGTDPTQIQVNRLYDGKVLVIGEVSPFFLRGDANGDHYVNIADPVSILQYLFANGTELGCPDAADANDDGRINIADAVAVLYTLFTRYELISQPYPAMGSDPTDDTLSGCVY
jgi:hypothetical protein